MLEARFIPGCCDTSVIFRIREIVFVKEQGFSADTEFDDIDKTALHVLMQDDGKPAATARLYRREGAWHIGRVAVLSEFRGKGIGASAVRLLMGKARLLGAGEVFLGAQKRVEAFYAGLGFVPCGPEYDDEGVPHVPMKAKLADACQCGKSCAGCGREGEETE